MRTTLLLVGLIYTTACGPKRDGIAEFRAMESELVEKHRPALSARLNKLRAVQAAAAKRPALSPLSPPATPSAVKLLGFGENDVLDRKFNSLEPRQGCTFFFGNDTFAKLNGAVAFWVGAEVLPGPSDRAKLEALFTAVETPEYAVVCAQLAAEEPVMVGGDSFTGGTYKAECRVFEIESAKYLGGFEANAKMHRASRQARKGANLEQTLENLVNSEMESGLRGFGVAPESYCSWQ